MCIPVGDQHKQLRDKNIHKNIELKQKYTTLNVKLTKTYVNCEALKHDKIRQAIKTA